MNDECGMMNEDKDAVFIRGPNFAFTLLKKRTRLRGFNASSGASASWKLYAVEKN